ncbi:hypothetical protein BJX65DRAFT_313942 [Aspergillus insuetus]
MPPSSPPLPLLVPTFFLLVSQNNPLPPGLGIIAFYPWSGEWTRIRTCAGLTPVGCLNADRGTYWLAEGQALTDAPCARFDSNAAGRLEEDARIGSLLQVVVVEGRDQYGIRIQGRNLALRFGRCLEITRAS